MPDPENDDRRSTDRWPVDVPGVLDVGSAEVPGLSDLTGEVASLLDGARPDPGRIEAALSEADVPALEDANVDTSTLSEATPLSPEDADAVVEAGGDAVALSVEAGEETANVVLDAGGEAVEVVVDEGGEEAAEAVADVLAAALDGV